VLKRRIPTFKEIINSFDELWCEVNLGEDITPEGYRFKLLLGSKKKYKVFPNEEDLFYEVFSYSNVKSKIQKLFENSNE